MSETKSGKSAESAKRIVMVVDDDVVFTRVVAQILSQRDVTPIVLHRAFGLLNAMAEHRPSLILLDVMMPGLDGASVTTLIRQDAELRSTIVVLCSGIDTPELAKRAQGCSADGFISKAGGLTQLDTEVRRWVDRAMASAPT